MCIYGKYTFCVSLKAISFPGGEISSSSQEWLVDLVFTDAIYRDFEYTQLIHKFPHKHFW